MQEYCKKIRYSTRKLARAGLRKNKLAGIAKDGYIYRCKKCGLYHITSINKNSRHWVTVAMNEK